MIKNVQVLVDNLSPMIMRGKGTPFIDSMITRHMKDICLCLILNSFVHKKNVFSTHKNVYNVD